ncbi:MAG: hypothetical protein HOM55_01280 [Proteobacteria bacterium]|jgi:hypothetical protein|nr:hypothetical protein [Pseudomonadota bacterium]
MKTTPVISLLIAAGLVSLNAANAHDISLHVQDGEAAKCEMMGGMDHANMDKDDPVMQAMMMKCAHPAAEVGEEAFHIEASEPRLACQHQRRKTAA